MLICLRSMEIFIELKKIFLNIKDRNSNEYNDFDDIV